MSDPTTSPANPFNSADGPLRLILVLDEQRAESLALTLLGHAAEMQDHLDNAAQYYSESLAIDYARGALPSPE